MAFPIPDSWWAPTPEEIKRFKEALGPEGASEFTDEQLPQLWRELWDWSNFLLDLVEEGYFDDGKGGIGPFHAPRVDR